jgi:hypothetical protein
MKNIFFAIAATLFFFGKMRAQPADRGPSLLDMLGDENELNHITNAFKGTRVINNHSIEMLAPGAMDFRILHRFGEVNDFYNAFGLDQATMRMSFDFGIWKNFSAGIGRSTSKKELDLNAKYRILWQSTGKKNVPISLVFITEVLRNGLSRPFGAELAPTFSNRLAYVNELLIGRKFSEKFSLQVAPMIIHRNVTNNISQKNDIFATSVGGRYKFRKRMAVVWDYTHAFNRFPNDAKKDPLSLGIDIETGGHVFQLHFSNAVGMNERAFVTDENDSWFKNSAGKWLNVRMGFNLSRVFQIKKQKI